MNPRKTWQSGKHRNLALRGFSHFRPPRIGCRSIWRGWGRNSGPQGTGCRPGELPCLAQARGA
eukprot:119150-Alexandrium_andersonii.AAC.1